MSKGLKNRQRAFIEHYLSTGEGGLFNATKAAEMAGYAHARQAGSRLLSNVNIRAAIEERLDELKLRADEVLIRLGQQARFDQLRFVDFFGDGVAIDLKQIKVAGLGHLVKKISRDRSENLTVEFYDSQAALIHLARHHGLFLDKTALTDPTGESAWNPFSGLSDEELDDELERLERLEQRGKRAVSPPPKGGTAAETGEPADDDPAGQGQEATDG